MIGKGEKVMKTIAAAQLLVTRNCHVETDDIIPPNQINEENQWTQR